MKSAVRNFDDLSIGSDEEIESVTSQPNLLHSAPPVPGASSALFSSPSSFMSSMSTGGVQVL